MEEGENSDWSWRKWTNGIFECWRMKTVVCSSWTQEQDLTSFYKPSGADAYIGNITYPIVFIERPFEFVSIQGEQDNRCTFVVAANYLLNSTSACGAYIPYRLGNAASATNLKYIYSIYARGKWK